jgi:hypothetical protein
MQRRQFNAWAAWLPWGGASAATAVLGGCGGGDAAPVPGGGDSEVVVGPLERTLAFHDSAMPIQVTTLDSGRFLAVWEGPDGAHWQVFSAEGRASMPEGVGDFRVALVQALGDGGFAFASTTRPHGMEPYTWTYTVQRHAADGTLRATVVKDADNATSVAALLRDGDFLAVSVNAQPAFTYNEPPQPTAYALTQWQRYNSAGLPMGGPLRFEGERGHWFSVSARPGGDDWVLRTKIGSFGAKYAGPCGSHVWLERYDASDTLQTSTLIAAAADIPDYSDDRGGSAFRTTVRGMAVWPASDGGAIVHWVGGHVFIGPAPRLNHFFRRFNAAGQPVGPVIPLWPKEEASWPVHVPELRPDGNVDVLVTRQDSTATNLTQQWTLETFDTRTGASDGGPRVLMEFTSRVDDSEQWQSVTRLHDGSLAILARRREVSADGEDGRVRVFLRRLSATGAWMGWPE